MDEEKAAPGPAETQSNELERLRRGNAELRVRAGAPKTSRARWFFSWVLIVIMCVATMGAALTVWVHYTALNTSRFVNAVAPLVKEKAVEEALSQEAIHRLFVKYNLKARIEKELKNKLPDLLKGVAEPASSGAEGLAKGLANDVLKSAAFQAVWKNILATTHSEALKGLRAKGAVNLNEQGEVTLDVTQLLVDLKDKLASFGLGFLNNVKIPSDLGRVVLYKNKQLGNAKKTVNVLDTLFWVLPWVAAFLLVCAVILAENRRRALVGSAIGIIIVMLAMLGVLKGFEGHYVNMIQASVNRSAATVVASHVEGGLYIVTLGLILLSVLTLVGAGLAGPKDWSWNIHMAVSRSGRKAKKSGEPVAGTWFDRYAWPLRLAGLTAAIPFMLYLPWANVAVVVVVCVLYALYLAAVEILR